uniref:Deacetylase sirtuin-type domain-containing protein n=1 Tax=Aureoumbra lagunensis TaxID=44058 RepID=A0A6S8C106_9STRA|mmetsp:Transcript_12512/g.16841  ORF Transcript_12512/g.16841 Transcript_12512/m.16841 type:complete len:527 (+) Transcript_12512:52-1632(+)|eukprot:CAMPEP_0197328962 /NCGR_PEP_ID=MMETSP0892-20130614/5275_1 /TAXON_ID=44058 ORGANISM="Aureoumbra lagunensis, Strain CCMP1510" /NCGR_SAMPLE_ID=MMETSP0892 /ASSEMBLY_ACC=CAM_ASM_000538 /LENGTH=526 /DNA_ID=CAMNT_0042825303 /DNA_START=48 /DNA_END=1628 /DNA_ORIENTATION=-
MSIQLDPNLILEFLKAEPPTSHTQRGAKINAIRHKVWKHRGLLTIGAAQEMGYGGADLKYDLRMSNVKLVRVESTTESSMNYEQNEDIKFDDWHDPVSFEKLVQRAQETFGDQDGLALVQGWQAKNICRTRYLVRNPDGVTFNSMKEAIDALQAVQNHESNILEPQNSIVLRSSNDPCTSFTSKTIQTVQRKKTRTCQNSTSPKKMKITKNKNTAVSSAQLQSPPTKFESLQLVAQAIINNPEKVLILTGAGIEIDSFKKIPPAPTLTHRAISFLRTISSGLLAHITTNISGLQLEVEQSDLVALNFVPVHRTIHDGQCSRRSCGKVYRPRRITDYRVPSLCDCKYTAPVVYGCVPSTKDVSSEDSEIANRVAQDREVLLILGNSLENGRNGTGLKWMSKLQTTSVVVVDPFLPQNIDKACDLVRERLRACHFKSKNSNKYLDALHIVHETADEFMRHLVTAIHKAGGDHFAPNWESLQDTTLSTPSFYDTHPPPPLSPSYEHEPTITVLKQLARRLQTVNEASNG